MTLKEKNIIIEKAINLYCECESHEEIFGKDDKYAHSLRNQWSSVYDIINLLGIKDDYIKELLIFKGELKCEK